MAKHLEFTVLGPPVSNQQRRKEGKLNREAWQATIRGAAISLRPPPMLLGSLKGTIINFFDGDGPPVDVDNMSKPIFDAMQGIVYLDDRQIIQAEISHQKIGVGYALEGVSVILATALQRSTQFVYVRVEDPVIPLPLPVQ